MHVAKTKDNFGLASCGVLALVIAASGALALWGYLSGPGGHPSNDVIANIWIVLIATFVAPAGAVVGVIGLATRHRRHRTLSAVPSFVGIVGNFVIFAGGLYESISLF